MCADFEALELLREVAFGCDWDAANDRHVLRAIIVANVADFWSQFAICAAAILALDERSAPVPLVQVIVTEVFPQGRSYLRSVRRPAGAREILHLGRS